MNLLANDAKFREEYHRLWKEERGVAKQESVKVGPSLSLLPPSNSTQVDPEQLPGCMLWSLPVWCVRGLRKMSCCQR